MRSLLVVHPDPDAVARMRPAFAGLADARVEAMRFEDVPPHAAFVTAGNSYGIMTAGIDAAVVRRFGPQIMKQVQRHIVAHWLGEQPVGTAFLLDTGDAWCPTLVHAPTMRIPGPIVGTDAVYRATWAALVALVAVPGLVVMPAMGTGFGAMPFEDAARQMAAAWRHALAPPTTLRDSWDLPLARERHILGR